MHDVICAIFGGGQVQWRVKFSGYDRRSNRWLDTKDVSAKAILEFCETSKAKQLSTNPQEAFGVIAGRCCAWTCQINTLWHSLYRAVMS